MSKQLRKCDRLNVQCREYSPICSVQLVMPADLFLIDDLPLNRRDATLSFSAPSVERKRSQVASR